MFIGAQIDDSPQTTSLFAAVGFLIVQDWCDLRWIFRLH